MAQHLAAVKDWHSRYVISWRFSNSLDINFCVKALEEAFSHGKPVIFDTDQCGQFTRREFKSLLHAQNVGPAWIAKAGQSTTY